MSTPVEMPTCTPGAVRAMPVVITATLPRVSAGR